MYAVHPPVIRTVGGLLGELLLWAFVVGGLLFLVLAGCGCGASQVRVESQAADLVMRLTNSQVLALNDLETIEGDDCIWKQPTIPEAEKCLVVVRDKWKGIWKAVRVFDAAHDVAADVLERGGTPVLADLQNAYCALLKLLPQGTFPDSPLLPCGGP